MQPLTNLHIVSEKHENPFDLCHGTDTVNGKYPTWIFIEDVSSLVFSLITV